MKNRMTQIGFSQRIRLEWMQQAANLVLVGSEKDTIYKILRDMLKEKLPVDSNSIRGSREKTITILLKTWLNVPPGLEGLRDSGLELLRVLPQDLHIAIHWGMTMAVYPFWGAVAGSVGRLLRLQDSFSTSQVQRRLKEQYGERETVSLSAWRIIRSFFDWQVITSSAQKGEYYPGEEKKISSIPLILWLLEAVLHATKSASGNFKEIVNSPVLFPFKLDAIVPDLLKTADRIEVVRHDLDEDIIILKK